jgi:hypothetical protein
VVDKTGIGIAEWAVHLRRLGDRNVLSTHWSTFLIELALTTCVLVFVDEHFGRLLLKDSGFEFDVYIFVLNTFDALVNELPDHELVHFFLLQNFI